MSQPVYIAGLEGTVLVDVIANFEPSIGLSPATFDRTAFYDELDLPNIKTTTALHIIVQIQFPYAKSSKFRDENDDPVESGPYVVTAHGLFMHIELEDGTIAFTNDEAPIQVQFSTRNMFYGSSLFSFISGRAYLAVSAQNPRAAFIKVKLVLGSQDVYVKNWSTTKQEPTWKQTVTVKKEPNQGKDDDDDGELDKVIRMINPAKRIIDFLDREMSGEVAFERSGQVDSNSKGGQVTPGQLFEQPEWTLVLIMPKPKPKPKPVTMPATYGWTSEMVFFLTGQSDWYGAHNDPTKMANKENQVNRLKKLLASIPKDRVKKIDLIGHASGLGDSQGNTDLSLRRANFVKGEITKYFGVDYSARKDDKGEDVMIIEAHGAPVDAKSTDNDPQDRNVEIQITYLSHEAYTVGG